MVGSVLVEWMAGLLGKWLMTLMMIMRGGYLQWFMNGFGQVGIRACRIVYEYPTLMSVFCSLTDYAFRSLLCYARVYSTALNEY